jgi:hypothetical protein
MVQYTIRPRRVIVNQTLAPGETRVFPILTTAVGSPALMASEPLSLRTELYLEANGKPFREIVNALNVGV